LLRALQAVGTPGDILLSKRMPRGLRRPLARPVRWSPARRQEYSTADCRNFGSVLKTPPFAMSDSGRPTPLALPGLPGRLGRKRWRHWPAPTAPGRRRRSTGLRSDPATTVDGARSRPARCCRCSLSRLVPLNHVIAKPAKLAVRTALPPRRRRRHRLGLHHRDDLPNRVPGSVS